MLTKAGNTINYLPEDEGLPCGILDYQKDSGIDGQ